MCDSKYTLLILIGDWIPLPQDMHHEFVIDFLKIKVIQKSVSVFG